MNQNLSSWLTAEAWGNFQGWPVCPAPLWWSEQGGSWAYFVSRLWDLTSPWWPASIFTSCSWYADCGGRPRTETSNCLGFTADARGFPELYACGKASERCSRSCVSLSGLQGGSSLSAPALSWVCEGSLVHLSSSVSQLLAQEPTKCLGPSGYELNATGKISHLF